MCGRKLKLRGIFFLKAQNSKTANSRQNEDVVLPLLQVVIEAVCPITQEHPDVVGAKSFGFGNGENM